MSRQWGKFLGKLDGRTPEEEKRRRSLIERFEGGRRSEPYRCRHRLVSRRGRRCLICGAEMAEGWREAWLEHGIQSGSRPLPESFGMEPTKMRNGGPPGEGATEVEGGGGNDPEG